MIIMMRLELYAALYRSSQRKHVRKIVSKFAALAYSKILILHDILKSNIRVHWELCRQKHHGYFQQKRTYPHGLMVSFSPKESRCSAGILQVRNTYQRGLRLRRLTKSSKRKQTLRLWKKNCKGRADVVRRGDTNENFLNTSYTFIGCVENGGCCAIDSVP